MSFRTQLAADLAVMLNSAEFGETVTYTPFNGVARTIAAVVDRSGLQQRDGTRHNYDELEITVFAYSDPVLGISDPQTGDKIQLGEDGPEVCWDFDSRLHLSEGGVTLRFKRTRYGRVGYSRPDVR